MMKTLVGYTTHMFILLRLSKDPRDAVILKKGSTVDGLKSLHKGAVVSKKDVLINFQNLPSDKPGGHFQP